MDLVAISSEGELSPNRARQTTACIPQSDAGITRAASMGLFSGIGGPHTITGLVHVEPLQEMLW